MSGDVRIDVDKPLHESERAWCFATLAGGTVWVPKSQAHLVEETRLGKRSLTLIVAEWLDRKEGLSDVL